MSREWKFHESDARFILSRYKAEIALIIFISALAGFFFGVAL